MKFYPTMIIYTILALAISSVSYASPVSPMTNKFHVGVDYSYNWLSEENNIGRHPSRTDRSAVGVKGGYRWTCLGVEVGADFLNSLSYQQNGNVKFRTYNFFIDGQYFYTLVKHLEFKALVGVGRLHTGFDSQVAGLQKDYARIKPRAGAGVQVNMSDWVSMDVMYKYQGGNGYYKYLSQVMVGLNLHF